MSLYCEAVVELLPWLLNRTLPDDQRAPVLEHLSDCRECREELRRTGWCWEAHRLHLAPDAIVARAAGEVAAGLPPEAVDEHLQTCRPCSDELDLAAAARAGMQDGPSVDDAGAAIRGWRVLALAASLFGLVMLAGYVQQRGRVQELLRGPGGPGTSAAPRLNVPIFELRPGETVRGDIAPVEIVLPGDARSVILILLPGRVPQAAPLRITLRDAAGDTVWSETGLSPSRLGDFTVELPSVLLRSGPMQFEVSAGDGGEPLERYDVLIHLVEP